MTELQKARKGIISPAAKTIATKEGLDAETVSRRIAEGKIAVVRHDGKILGIGQGLSTKVNINIGTSTDKVDLSLELRKLKLSCHYKTDTVMDLSTGGDLRAIRRKITKASTVPVGTVPLYQAAIETVAEKKSFVKMTEDKLFDVIEQHAQDGIAFITVHCGVTLKTMERLRNNPRAMMVVSRGGVFSLCWMVANEKENPLFAGFDRLCDIARKYDLVLSLGDGMRPGSILDSTDPSQIEELITLGDLTRRAWDAGVQVMIEGPGHIPLNEVPANVMLEKKLCNGAPFYVLGPLVTDIAPGYDHITSAIGGALAGWHGADFLCAVTPSEHLSLPGVDEVVEGLMATRIAAHAADIAKGVPGARAWDRSMDKARRTRDWKGQKQFCINPERFAELHGKYHSASRDVCTMCGKYCAMKLVEKALMKTG